MGIQLVRATLFLALGAAIGGLAGGSVVALAVQDRLNAVAATIPLPAPIATAAAVAPPPSAAPAPTQGVPVIPAAAVWALGQSAVINARLTEPMQVLQAAAVADTVDTGAVASALRSIASDTTSGADLSARLGAWPAAAGVAADLRVFYGDARTAALAGLGAALSNQPAYRQAARDLVAILGSLGTLGARSRDLAAVAGITLAPVDVPAATDAAGPSGPGSEPIP